MNPHGDGKPEPSDPDQVLRLLELELAQRRVALQHARSPYRAFRLASFIFLFAVMIGVALAFYYVFSQAGSMIIEPAAERVQPPHLPRTRRNAKAGENSGPIRRRTLSPFRDRGFYRDPRHAHGRPNRHLQSR